MLTEYYKVIVLCWKTRIFKIVISYTKSESLNYEHFTKQIFAGNIFLIVFGGVLLKAFVKMDF